MKTKLVIFGITGDLAQNRLIPALANIIEAKKCDELTIIGVSRRKVEQFQLLGDHHVSLNGTTSLFRMDLTNSDEYKKLGTYINQQPDEQVLYYLSVPPDSMSGIIENLGRAGLNGPTNKLLLEKPFGTDVDSAKAMIDHIASYFSEEQIYRIDHYLAKEMAQNIATFRASNAIFAHLWSADYIDRIEVLALESKSIEGRVGFYEQTGALRDLVQGHLLQLLALTLMPMPEKLDWDELPALRLEALKALQPVDPARSCRGQYDTYREEVSNPDSMVETFVSLELQSSDPKWQGTRIALTTGKALERKKTEVRIHFKRADEAKSNYLIFKIQPNEGIAIDLMVKKPGYERDVEHQKLSYTYPVGTRLPDAYEQILVDAINTRKSLFATSDEVIRAWELLAPLQEAWITDTNLKFYPKGSNARTVIEQA
jgi:glucose-6-phosphate 1-dehydrogenase